MPDHHRLPRASDVPALTAFARGYLHEDVIAEHGSAVDAAAAFARDASPHERRQLIHDLQRVAKALEDTDGGDDRVARFFTDELRASWAPSSLAELRRLLERLERAPA